MKPAEVAPLLRTSERQVRNMAERGQFVPLHKIPGLGRRFKATEVTEWLSKLGTAALLLVSCGPVAPTTSDTDASSGSASSGTTTGTDRQQTSSSAPAPETDSADPSAPDLGMPEPTSTGTTGDASSSTSSTSGDGQDGLTGDVLPTCYGEPCDGVCGGGMACMPHPKNGVAICVTLCPAFFCDVGPAFCSPTGAPPLAECIRASCFPILCEVLADCPDGAVECVGGLCF